MEFHVHELLYIVELCYKDFECFDFGMTLSEGIGKDKWA